MSGTPGTHMKDEIGQQPAIFADLLAAREQFAEVAAVVAERRPRFALLAARGSSDHAALYAKYLIEVLLQLPVGLTSPSTTTLYGAQPDLTDVLLVTVSQSGGSPDLVAVTESGRARGALTVAVTNTADSPLAEVAELSLTIRAGKEQAVAATKTYSATLLALYLLIDAIRGGDGAHARALPDLAATTLTGARDAVEEAVQRYRFAGRMVTTGRGYSLASAHETALKLAETSYLSARSYSGADLLHGPVAAIDAETAVLALCSAGPGGESTREVIEAVHGRGADICAIGSASAKTPATHRIPVPETAEEVAPVLEILPAQQLALGLALARGIDPDNPRGLQKVTKTT
ncbi:SIS domain-containing protein [Saccharopolyspora mangrovi]|uniref:SIS domain-containing protein n=1 Tax=Saccharopolyspora mangrovi TaxID=3082379 RepID=A0ABU6ACT9_9PSEU|nr:SIS domain-containing protein [Saccharopolyspora sp. S2-29]MEB3369335.1 SIS domain-containing protein [Saccharopolyspora sp. S2-29]